jgi:hypothetical protein
LPPDGKSNCRYTVVLILFWAKILYAAGVRGMVHVVIQMRKVDCCMKAFPGVLLLALGLVLSGCSIAHSDDQPPLKVLFVGNGYTSVNDLPSLLVSSPKVQTSEF